MPTSRSWRERLAAAVTTRHIDGALWEIKSSQQRVFCAVVIAGKLILLHAYKKQGQKAPPNEIRIARKRLGTYLEGLE
ncbi:type II toxin-antitoxin system RelE/ParE family toxin [Myxococcota bacterium]|nr:type II toxin-antitoxin system RelE/ParE family toxin [Myxococcota bacterium]